MSAQFEQFSTVTSVRVVPDRRSWAVCGGRFSVVSSKTGLRPAQTAIQYRRATTRMGELDGAKGIDGG
jgi:hypothetical protein